MFVPDDGSAEQYLTTLPPGTSGGFSAPTEDEWFAGRVVARAADGVWEGETLASTHLCLHDEWVCTGREDEPSR